VLDLRPNLVAIVGANNSGKSTLLRAIDAPRRILNGRADFTSIPPRLGSLNSDAFLHFDLDFAAPRFPFTFDQLRQVVDRYQGVQLEPNAAISGVLSARNQNGFRWGTYLMAFHQTGLSGIFGRDLNTFTAANPAGDVPGARPLIDATAAAVREGIIATWGHTDTDFFEAGLDKRMRGTTEPRLRRTLTSLRLNFPREFDRLQTALTHSLPEFGRIAFDEDPGRPDTYIPQLELRGTSVALRRESVGAGSWTFLCVLAATRMAHAAGARVMLLDEPTLFMHPQLERELLRALTDPSQWDGRPLKLVIATHSPILVDAAFDRGGLRILDWKDRAKAEAQIINVRSDQDLSRHFAASHTSAGEMVYAETPLLVEGPSDYAVLRLLEGRVSVPCRVFILETKDSYTGKPKREREHALQILKRMCELRLLGRFTKPRVMLDADAKEAVVAATSKLNEATIPILLLIGKPDSDLESLFCEQAFLTSFFVNASAMAGRSPLAPSEVTDAVAKSLANQGKGSSVIYPLFQQLFGEPEDKPGQLAAVVSFLLDNENATEAAPVWRALEPVLAALDAKTDLTTLTGTVKATAMTAPATFQQRSSSEQ